MIEIWTDGACSGNPGLGGWGAVIVSPEGERTLSGFAPETTNNRMELIAAIKALETCDEDKPIKLWTDSKYVKDGITQWIAKWRTNQWRTAARKPVKNKDLWQKLSALNEKLSIEWCWIKGHSGDRNNERADELARAAIENHLA